MKTMTDMYTKIFNEAYNIYTDECRSDGARYNDMQRFLMEQVRCGVITMLDRCYIASDVMRTASL